jgi:NAD(P)-dependent dehydrogenase (short-subunit alcohol dehydrogenase family)
MVFPFYSKPFFQPDKDIPNLSGKVILVTGGNVGLGKESILQLAHHNPSKIYMGSRNKEKAQAAIAEIEQAAPEANIIFLELDLSSFSSIQKAAETFLSQNNRLDILMNNAGIMATPAGLTEDGYELQFGTNHMGHALLTKLLLPILEETANNFKTLPRVVILASEAHKFAPKAGLLLSQDKTDLASIGTITRYGQSKLANIYHAEALAKRYPSLKVVAIHPGMVATNIAGNARETYPFLGWAIETVGKWVLANPGTGALTQLWAATAKEGDVRSGAFYYPVGVEFKGPRFTNADVQVEELWEWTEKELRDYGG